jgi:sulfite exporter TauE/SafE
MDSTLSLGAAFLIGLLGATHCIGMCGGITGALSMAIPPGPNQKKRILATLLSYNIGRIFSYGLAGFILGTLGWLLGEQATIISIGLRTFAAALLIVMGLYIADWWKGLAFIEKWAVAYGN